MKALIRVCVAGVLPVMAFSLAGCGGARHSPDERFYLIAVNLQLPYWQAATNGFMRAARDFGVFTEVGGPKTYDPEAQHTEFRRVLGKRPSGILISPADPKLVNDDIAAAISQGIPVLTIDSDAPDSKRLFFIGTDNHEAGRLGGRELVKRLNGKGNVIVFTMPNQTNLIERLKGYRDVLADHPGVKITDMVDINGDPRVAFDTAQEIVEKRKDKVDAFVCLEAMAGKEIADVLTRNKVSGKVVVAMDTDKDTLDWIQRGVIQATIAQKPFTMAYYGAQLLDDIYHSKLAPLDKNWRLDPFAKLPASVDTGLTLVDSSNVGAFLAAQESIGK